MHFVPFSVKFAFSSLLLLFLRADSIFLSSESVNYHFQQAQSYIYQAAKFDNSVASMLLFERTNDANWLQLAAKQGDKKAAFLWYQQNPSAHQVWLEYSANNGYAPAVLLQINELIRQEQWLQAQQKLQQYKGLSEFLTEQNQSSVASLEQVIELALLPSEQVLPELIDSNESNTRLDYQCRVKIQPYVASANLAKKVSKFEQAFADSALHQLPLCFNKTQLLPELKSICQQDRQGRIDCDIKKLAMVSHRAQQPEQNFSHILVVVEQGEANTRGGLMFLDQEDSTSVFLHELGHWFGFVDEYQIGTEQQKQLCQVDDYGFLGLNLFVTRTGISQQQAEKYANRKLYQADTCNGSGFQAYKFSQQPSFMQYLQASISPFYFSLLSEQINWSRIVPAAMNFAHVYKDNYDLYLSYLKDAASSGYQGAITEFSHHLVEQGSYLEAKNLLEFGAEHGGINSQLLLGHAYLEGSWLPRDLTESALWYKKAAEQNDGYGLYFYGKCLEMGWGCIQSQEQAYEYYRRSAQQGNKLAKRKLTHLNAE